MQVTSKNPLRGKNMLPVDIVLSPLWWHRHEGITFDEDFFYASFPKVLHQEFKGVGRPKSDPLIVELSPGKHHTEKVQPTHQEKSLLIEDHQSFHKDSNPDGLLV